MKTFFLRFFTWWNGATFGTLLTTSLYGEFVGEDEFGNRYYRTKGGKIDPALGFERRWVIYNGVVEASSIPPSWHGWMHHTVDVPPTQETVVPRPWWKPHRPNLTGTPGGAPSHRFDLGAGPQAESHGRLQGLDPGPVTRCGEISAEGWKPLWLFNFQRCCGIKQVRVAGRPTSDSPYSAC